MEKLKREKDIGVSVRHEIFSKLDEIVDWINKFEYSIATPSPATSSPGKSDFSYAEAALSLNRDTSLILSPSEANLLFRDVQMLFHSYGEGLFVFHAYHGGYSVYTMLKSRPNLIVDACELKKLDDIMRWDGVYVNKGKITTFHHGEPLPSHIA